MSKRGNKYNSATDRIVKWDCPALKSIAQECTESDRNDIRFEHLRSACVMNPTGAGLSANQIGWLKRVCFIYPLRKGEFFIVNPVITEFSGEMEWAKEGCLSFPGVFKNIQRHKFITVEFLDMDWVRRVRSYNGWTARVIQHEVDHLDGICKVGDAWRAMEVA